MPIPFQCASCGHSGQAKDELAGRSVKCPKCEHTIAIPDDDFFGPEMTGPGRHESYQEQAVSNAQLEHARKMEAIADKQAKHLQKISDNVGCIYTILVILLILSGLATLAILFG